MSGANKQTGPWTVDSLPHGVQCGEGSVITGENAFRRYFSQRESAIVVGDNCFLDGMQFALGKQATLRVGDYVYGTNTVVLAEQEIRIGSYVFIGFNVAIADTDFHPLDPAQRMLDAIACSPAGRGRARPPIPTAPVVIEDDVWIGPNATILKGVRIGAGAFIEPGSVVTRDVPPRARVLGNPAQVVGEV
jgi:acetyltransferase-like isoleucine patch superfamily enzyme